jgi:hypothetical protein
MLCRLSPPVVAARRGVVSSGFSPSDWVRKMGVKGQLPNRRWLPRKGAGARRVPLPPRRVLHGVQDIAYRRGLLSQGSHGVDRPIHYAELDGGNVNAPPSCAAGDGSSRTHSGRRGRPKMRWGRSRWQRRSCGCLGMPVLSSSFCNWGSSRSTPTGLPVVPLFILLLPFCSSYFTIDYLLSLRSFLQNFATGDGHTGCCESPSDSSLHLVTLHLMEAILLITSAYQYVCLLD